MIDVVVIDMYLVKAGVDLDRSGVRAESVVNLLFRINGERDAV